MASSSDWYLLVRVMVKVALLYTLPLYPLRYPPQHLAHQAIHLGKCKPLFPEVFDGCANMVEFFSVDDEEAVVDVLCAVNFDGGVLRIVFFKVETKGRRNALGVYGCAHSFGAFGEL